MNDDAFVRWRWNVKETGTTVVAPFRERDRRGGERVEVHLQETCFFARRFAGFCPVCERGKRGESG